MIKIAHLHRKRGAAPPDGWWAYNTSGLEIYNYPLSKYDVFDLDKVDEDIVIQDDRRLRTRYQGGGVPIAYHVRSCTENWPRRFHQRHMLAEQGFDLIMVDAVPLKLFGNLGVPVIRCNYCVNRKIFKDYGLEKDIDVSCLLRFDDPRRQELREFLKSFCLAHNLVGVIQKVYPSEDYAKTFNRSKITINMSKFRDRNFRIFDSMACRTCLVTDKIPVVAGEEREAGVHYLEYAGFENLGDIILELLNSGTWRDFSDAGYELVMEKHTWEVRARELRDRLLVFLRGWH